MLFAGEAMHVMTELIAVKFDEFAAVEQIRPLCPQGTELQPTSGDSQASPPVLPSLTDTDDIAELLGDTAHRLVSIRVEAKVGAMAYRSSGLPSMF